MASSSTYTLDSPGLCDSFVFATLTTISNSLRSQVLTSHDTDYNVSAAGSLLVSAISM